jgi:Scavenger mRNA decapping enzyme C-term binding
MPTCALDIQNYYVYGKNNRRLVVESPDIYESKSMRSYIEQEIARPCKQWIHDVISSKREVDRVRLRTDEFVLLPDVDSINKRFQSVVKDRLCIERHNTWPNPNAQQFEFHPSGQGRSVRCPTASSISSSGDLIVSHAKYKKMSPGNFHWLAVVTDPSLKTLRDLRGYHISLLKKIYSLSCRQIFQELGIERDQVLAYMHYPPSVYQLHIHFKYPVKAQPAHDAFRIHPLLSVINNLEVDSEYYAKSFIQIPVYPNTEYYSALLWGGLSEDQKKWLVIRDTPSTSPSSLRCITDGPRETDTPLATSEAPRSESSSLSHSA